MDRFAGDWRTAGLDLPTMALLEWTEKLTLRPAACEASDIDRLREAGWSDAAISDATQVCAYFNYINRIAEGLGVDREDWIDDTGREIGPDSQSETG
ncbi:MAG: peroxidase [Acidimicrobiia bacterium]